MGWVKYECAICKVGDFANGKPVTLQLDHINGVNNDHSKKNLRLLCGTCHSQTSTYCGRNFKNLKEKGIPIKRLSRYAQNERMRKKGNKWKKCFFETVV